MELNKTKTLIELKNFIAQEADKLPFISQYWEIETNDIDVAMTSKKINFGFYNTNDVNSTPFYKPLSKIIDISKV